MDTRKKIVDTAAKLFYEQGYNSTGINQIIAEAGIAKASLYAHFSSKEDLLKEYLLRTSVSTNEVLRNITNQKQTAEEKILSIFDFLVDFSDGTGFNGCHFLNVSAEIPQNNATILPLIQGQKDKIRALFAEILTPIGKESLADELYILFEGAMVTSKVYKQMWTIETTRRIVEKLL